MQSSTVTRAMAIPSGTIENERGLQGSYTPNPGKARQSRERFRVIG
jgi:hypothetical protein